IPSRLQLSLGESPQTRMYGNASTDPEYVDRPEATDGSQCAKFTQVAGGTLEGFSRSVDTPPRFASYQINLRFEFDEDVDQAFTWGLVEFDTEVGFELRTLGDNTTALVIPVAFEENVVVPFTGIPFLAPENNYRLRFL